MRSTACDQNKKKLNLPTLNSDVLSIFGYPLPNHYSYLGMPVPGHYSYPGTLVLPGYPGTRSLIYLGTLVPSHYSYLTKYYSWPPTGYDLVAHRYTYLTGVQCPCYPYRRWCRTLSHTVFTKKNRVLAFFNPSPIFQVDKGNGMPSQSLPGSYSHPP